MIPKSYSYDTHVEWTTKRRGEMRSAGLPLLTISTPPEFRGEPGFWTPEHLFVAAAESCLMATFLGIAENSRLAVLSYRSSAIGKLESPQGAGLRFTEIAVFPEVELTSVEDRTRAGHVMAKAEKTCLIANSMAMGLRVEPRFFLKAQAA